VKRPCKVSAIDASGNLTPSKIEGDSLYRSILQFKERGEHVRGICVTESGYER
jgi:hypothetical protein